MLKNHQGNVTFTSTALNSTSVDNLLAVYAYMDGNNGTTSYGTGRTISMTGTSAVPTGTITNQTTAGSNFALSGGTNVAVTGFNHGYSTGDYITISGITGADATSFNGTFKITVTSSTAFSYTALNANAPGSGTGTATCGKASSTSCGQYYKQVILSRGATVTTN